MILDLHTHSIASDDSRAKVDNYCQWIRKKAIPLHGFVLTEHRTFDDESDYSELAEQYELTILKASEVETDHGHVLVFGVNDQLRSRFDFADVTTPLPDLLEGCAASGAFAAPCHPARRRVGLFSHYEERGPVAEVHTVEVVNGGSLPGEDELSLRRAAEFGYRGFGGSDSHVVSRIGRCATRFERSDIATIDDLVEELYGGRFEPVVLGEGQYVHPEGETR